MPIKRIKLSFVDENISAIAVLLEEKAPATCKMIWDTLKTPLENKAIHAMYTGRELSFGVPNDCMDESTIFDLPPENQTMFPLPGSLVWNAYRPYQWLGTPHAVYDFGIFYGAESRILLPTGWRPSNHFGDITENLEQFAAVCARCQREGVKTIRIERL
ncbi:MAG: DUF3830 family protein [Clostridia bacterium]